MAQTESSSLLRLGVDFGYGFTGVALMDDARVLKCKVIIHNSKISDKLRERRENRAMRRRNRSRRKRLRDFRALLKEMKLPAILPARDEETQNRPGNRLYGIAHWRGWDYADIDELLMEEKEKGPPGKTQIVRDVDNFLKEQTDAPLPANRLKHGGKPKKSNRESADDYGGRIEKWEAAGKALTAGERPPPELLRYVELKESCLGELADAFRKAHDAQKKAKKKSDDDDLIAAAEQAQEYADNLREQLCGDEENSLDEISEWIDERLNAVFDGGIFNKRREKLHSWILARLGLADGKKAFDEGKIYRPHRNRHRKEALRKLHEKMRKILGKEKSEKWMKRAEAILNQSRPSRIDNRRMGKCPAIDEETGDRCNLNVPRRSKPEIRQLLFEIEARQMNIADEGEWRKLSDSESDSEIADLLACANFDKGEINGEKWRAFFKRLPTPPRKRDESGEELRNKKDQLRDIVRNKGKGRTKLCCKHLEEKNRLLKDGETESRRERILGRADAPPSLLHRADKILSVVRKMLAKEGFPNPSDAPIIHVGVESARFDTASLSSLEGRKLKKSDYSKPRRRSLKSLIDAQNGLCMFCGEMMAHSTVDHVFAKARKGGDAQKNRVAMCAACNIQKWKFADVQLNENALAALAENSPDKAEFLRAQMNQDAPLHSLAGAQATMFGGKIIRGALAEMLLGDKDKAADKKLFPIERAADLVRLRERWFPIISRKKRALRAAKPKDEKGMVITVGETREEAVGELQHPDKKLPKFIAEKNGVFTFTPIPNKDEGVTTLWLKDGDSGRPFRIVVQPKKDDPARDYHHAIDAIIAAAPVDWKRIAQMARDQKQRSQKTADIFEEEIKKAHPLDDDGKSSFPDSAPPKDESWWIESKQDKSGYKRAKTKRQPLGFWKNPDGKKIVVQRKPLDRLPRKDVESITDAAAEIRGALAAAWEEISKLPPEEREKLIAKDGDKECIADRWFLQLDKTHILHPHRTRSAPVEIKDASSPFAVRRKDALHYFDREEYWGEVAVWEANGKMEVSRRRPQFYVNAENKQEWENDKRPPADDKILWRIRRGMSVSIIDEDGIWQVTKLNKGGATLIAEDGVAHAILRAEGKPPKKPEKTKAYSKIRPV